MPVRAIGWWLQRSPPEPGPQVLSSQGAARAAAAAGMVTADIATIAGDSARVPTRRAAAAGMVTADIATSWRSPYLGSVRRAAAGMVTADIATLGSACTRRTFYQAAAGMVTADIATVKTRVFQLVHELVAAAGMVTADIATSSRTYPGGVPPPQREWSLPTLRLKDTELLPDELSAGPQREWSLPTLRLLRERLSVERSGPGRSVNGHCRHCDFWSRLYRSGLTPQREWSLPTLRLSVRLLLNGRISLAGPQREWSLPTLRLYALLCWHVFLLTLAAAGMVTADIATRSRTSTTPRGTLAAAGMVTADIATSRWRSPRRCSRFLQPQREWSLPTLRLWRWQGSGGGGRSPQREWSLPTLRLSESGVIRISVCGCRSVNGHCRHCDSPFPCSRRRLSEAAAGMVTADIATG